MSWNEEDDRHQQQMDRMYELSATEITCNQLRE